MSPLRLALITLTPALFACGDDTPARHDSDVATTDSADTTSDTAADTAADTTLDSEPDTGTAADTADDRDSDTVEEVHEPVACEAGAACNALLDEHGACPGACIVVPDVTTCKGEVHRGLCYRYTPFDQTTDTVDFGDFTVTPITWPADTTIGATSALDIRVSNDTAQALAIPFHTKNPGTFTFADASWDGLDTIALAPHASFELTATITAVEQNVFNQGGIIVTFNLDDQLYEPHSLVHFPATAALTCGGESFPESYCATPDNCYQNAAFYNQAECCDDVFYPSAQCCSSDDCVSGGACVDGRCVTDLPALNSANTLPLGNQRVLLIIADANKGLPFDPCADRFDALKDDLQLDKVEAWFDELAERRFGHSTLDLRWEVRTGMAIEDVLQPGDNNDGNTFLTRIDEYLTAHGCGPVLAAYDKVIAASSGIDLGGYGGIYGNEGHVVTLFPNLPYLLTHELTHSFGAFDLYLDMGGAFQYYTELMGNNVAEQPYPGDGVAWGEIGYSDYDRDGVIDLAEFASEPTALELADLHALLTTKNTLEISWRFVGMQDGRAMRVVVTQYQLEVPGTPTRMWWGANTLRTQVYAPPELDLDAVRAAGHVDAHIQAELRFTDHDWTRRVLTFDETRAIPVTIEE